VDGIILAGDLNTMRVAVRASDDAMTLLRAGISWTVEGTEKVEVTFEWQTRPEPQAVTESDCLCPAALATALVQYLFAAEACEAAVEEWPDWSPVHQAFACAISMASIN
jgi:hypothetical protein